MRVRVRVRVRVRLGLAVQEACSSVAFSLWPCFSCAASSTAESTTSNGPCPVRSLSPDTLIRVRVRARVWARVWARARVRTRARARARARIDTLSRSFCSCSLGSVQRSCLGLGLGLGSWLG